MNSDPIVVNQHFDVPISAVWAAITDKDQMRQWYSESMTEFKPEVGFEIEFNVRCEDRDFLHQWKVTDVVPQQRISHQWRFGGYPGDSTLNWEFAEEENGTTLVLTHEVHAPFPSDDPIFSRESGVAGWNYLVKESLRKFLDSFGK